MSIILKQEVERLRALLKDDPENSSLRMELAKVEKDLAGYKPAATGFNVCESCEG